MAIVAATAVAVCTFGNAAVAEPTDSDIVKATEIQDDINLHPILGKYGLSVTAVDEGEFAIEGMMDDPKAAEALRKFLADMEQDVEIEDNVNR